MRRPARQRSAFAAAKTRVYRQPAPVKGWIASENIVGMPPDSAYQLDNWFPETNSIKLRPGYDVHNVVLGGAPIDTIMVYQAGASLALFAASGSAIYDVSAAAASPWTEAYWTPWELAYQAAPAPDPWSSFYWGPATLSFNPPEL
jgi:hypothetical protein